MRRSGVRLPKAAPPESPLFPRVCAVSHHVIGLRLALSIVILSPNSVQLGASPYNRSRLSEPITRLGLAT